MSKNKKTTSAEALAKKAILEARLVREASEEMIRKDLSERYYPQIKKFIKESILSENDEDVIGDEDLEDLESALSEEEDEELSLDEAVYEVEDEEESDDLDGLEDLDESDDELDKPVEEAPVEDEEAMDEEYDQEFLDELASLLEEEDFDDDLESLEEDIDADTDVNALEEGEDLEDVLESTDGINKGDENSADIKAIVEENNVLKRALKRVEKSLTEMNLDNKKSKAIKNLLETYSIKGAAKLRVLCAIDEAKSERELNIITQSLRRQYRKSDKSVKNESVSRRRIGKSASSVKKTLSGKKSKQLKETKELPFANRWAELASIESR